ncbi:hypothetical protein [Maribacter sp. LLG6340-A2]|uniref:hypothetical protein n=1 Tax=Maribacter sp. LLG6340-A2 TaxID=3160834 RepID=UPI003867E569
MNIRILTLTVVLLSICADVYSQKKVRKVGKDTLFFKYDTNFLQKTEKDSSLFYLSNMHNNLREGLKLSFRLEELFNVKNGQPLNFKDYLKKRGLFNEDNFQYKYLRIFKKFEDYTVIFVDSTEYSDLKFYQANAILDIE